LAEKAGYVPAKKYEIAKAAAEKSAAEAAAAKTAAEAAAKKAGEATYASIIGAGIVLLVGGIAFSRRRQLAEFVLNQEKKKASPEPTV